MIESQLISATDDTLRRYIINAEEKIVFFGSGISKKVAKSLVSMADKVAYVYLDNSEQCYRTGYGDHESIKLLKNADIPVYNVSDVRINILVVDDIAIVYSPIPLVIEQDAEYHNATGIITSYDAVRKIIKEAHITDSEEESESLLSESKLIGSVNSGSKEIPVKPITDNDVKINEKTFKENPVQSFNLRRKTNVYTNHIGFIEIHANGIKLDRHTVHIPEDLLNNADNTTRGKLKASYSLFDAKSPAVEIANKMASRIQYFRDNYTYSVKKYGNIYIKSQQQEIDKEIEELKKYIYEMKGNIISDVRETFCKIIKEVSEILLPLLSQKPPERLIKLMKGKPITDDDIREYIESRMYSTMKSPETFVGRIDFEVIYKAIEYNMFKDDNFINELRKDYDLDQLFNEKGFFNEFDAVEAEKIQPKQTRLML